MTNTIISNAQYRVLEDAANFPDSTVEKFMDHLPAGAKQSMLAALIKKCCITQGKNGHFITQTGLLAIGREVINQVVEKTKTEPKQTSKQVKILTMLREGTTIKALMETTSWQRHSVYGCMANLKKKQESVHFI